MILQEVDRRNNQADQEAQLNEISSIPKEAINHPYDFTTTDGMCDKKEL